MPGRNSTHSSKKRSSSQRTALPIEGRKRVFKEQFRSAEDNRSTQSDRRQGKSLEKTDNFEIVDGDQHGMKEAGPSPATLSGPDGRRARKQFSAGRESFEDEDYYGEADPQVRIKSSKNKRSRHH